MNCQKIMEPKNSAPIIISLTANPDSIYTGGYSILICQAIDGDYDDLNYTWNAPSGLIRGSGDSISWQSPEKHGIYSISCKVDDGKDGQDIKTTNIIVSRFVNNPPTILSLTATPDSVQIGKTSFLRCEAIDPENDYLYYSWEREAGYMYAVHRNIARWTAPYTEGIYYISCKAYDGYNGIDSRTILITVYDGQDWKDHRWTIYTHYNSGLPSRIIECIAIDRNHNKWIGTEDGLARLDVDANWTVYNSSNSALPDDRVRSLTIDDNDHVWIGTPAGLSEFDGKTG